MKLKPIIIESNLCANIGEFIITKSPHNILICGTKVNNAYNCPDTEIIIYLIDPTADIKEGDYYIAFNVVKRAEKVESQLPYHECYKIVCSTDNLALEPYQGHFEGLDCTKYMPKLSDEAIESLTEYYNSNGKLPDEIEVNTYMETEYKFGIDSSWEEIELNQEGNVDINIFQEKNYTKEEVINLLDFVNESLPDLYSRFNSEVMLNEWITDNLK